MMVENERWRPDHEPLWTCVGVTGENQAAVLLESEVWTYDLKNPESK
jgi:hypothetical protein